MKRILFILLLCPLFVSHCYADDLFSQIEAYSGAEQIETALPEDVKDINGTLRLDGSYDTEGAIRRLLGRFTALLSEQLFSSLKAAAALFVLALFCMTAESVFSSKEMQDTVDRIACCSATLFVFGNFTQTLEQAAETIRSLSDFAHVLLPVIFTASAAGGAVLSATARYSGACLAMDVLITAAQNYILPMIYLFFALTITQSLYDNSVLQMLSRLCKWGVTSLLTVLTMSFGACLSLTGLIAGSRDAMAVKTARTVISRSLPIVGGLLADSASVLLSAASLIRNSVGIFAMIAVCAFCISPVAAYSVKLLLLRGLASVVDFVPGARLPKLITAMSSVYAMLLGLLGSCAAILFVAIVSGIKAVSPA